MGTLSGIIAALIWMGVDLGLHRVYQTLSPGILRQGVFGLIILALILTCVLWVKVVWGLYHGE